MLTSKRCFEETAEDHNLFFFWKKKMNVNREGLLDHTQL